MDEYRDPQQPIAATPMYSPPPAYSPSTVPSYTSPKVSRFVRFRRTARLVLRRLLRGGIIAGRALRPYALFAVVVVGLVGVIGWMSFMLWGPKAAPAVFSRADSIPPAAAVETFIQGQKTFNADIMWDAYSTQYQASQLANGATKATLQAQVDNLRNIGLEFLRYDYIGGVKEDNGGMYFYTVDLRVRNQQRRFPIIFHADADGKITEIESVLAPQNGASTNSQQ